MEDILKSAGISASIISALGAVWVIIKKVNNKRCHSSCCGKDMDVIVAVNDVEDSEKKPTPRSSPRIHPLSEIHSIQNLDLNK